MTDARRDSRDTTVHRQSTRALAAWCEPEEQGQRQRWQGQGQRQGRQGQGQRQGREDQVEQEGKERRPEKVLLLQQNWPRESRVQKKIAGLEEKPVAATPHPSDTATMTVPLQCLLPDESHTTTFILALPCANDETADKSSSKGSVSKPGAGSTAPEGTKHVRLVPANPSCATHLVMDTCARWHRFRSPRRQTTQCMVMWARNRILA